MTTSTDEAARILLERALRTTHPSVIVDAWGPEDWSDTYGTSDHVIYAHGVRTHTDPASGMIHVEAKLEANWDASSSYTFLAAAPYFGDRYVTTSWKVIPSNNPVPGFREVEVIGYVPELLDNPSLRGRASSWEAPGCVVGAVSGVLDTTPNSPWSSGYSVRAEEVKNAPNSFLVRVSNQGGPIASATVVAALTPRLNALTNVGLGILTAVSSHDTTTARLSFN